MICDREQAQRSRVDQFDQLGWGFNTIRGVGVHVQVFFDSPRRRDREPCARIMPCTGTRRRHLTSMQKGTRESAKFVRCQPDQLAIASARDSRMTITLISPGYCNRCSMDLAMSFERTLASASVIFCGSTSTLTSRPAWIAKNAPNAVEALCHALKLV